MANDPYGFLTPEEMAILKAHYILVKDCRSKEETEKALKGWSLQQRRVVVRLQERVREEGWVIDDQYPSGSLKFAAIDKSPMDQVMGLSDDDFILYRQGLLRFVSGRLCRVEC